MICADFRFELGNDDAMPKELFTAKHMRRLVDVMHSRAHAAGRRAQPTFHGGQHEGTRIDGIMMDPRLFTAMTVATTTPIAGLPGHSLLKVALDMDTTAQQVTTAADRGGQQQAPALQSLAHRWFLHQRAVLGASPMDSYRDMQDDLVRQSRQ